MVSFVYGHVDYVKKWDIRLVKIQNYENTCYLSKPVFLSKGY